MSLVDLIYSTDTVLPQDLKPTNYYSATGSSESGNHHLSTVNIGLIVGGCVFLLLVLSSLIVFGILCGYRKWKMRGITKNTEGIVKEEVNVLTPIFNTIIFTIIVELPDAAVANISGQDKRHSSMLYNEIYDNKEPRASSLGE